MIADEANYFYNRVKDRMLCCWAKGLKWLISTDFQLGHKFENKGAQS